MSDYVPQDVMRSILARLPVEDVLRCTSVCKSWYSLIVSPSFESLHLNLSCSNQESRVLVRYNKDGRIRSHYSLRFDSEKFDEIAEIENNFGDDQWLVIDCINGLFCLFWARADMIMLWNPSLRKSIVLPRPPRVLSRLQYGCFSHKRSVGFGFVAASNEYKIVIFSYDYESERAVQIYELSTGSWHDLKLPEYYDVSVNNPQTHLNGILHWFSRNPDSTTKPNLATFICSFDLKNEKFNILTVPSCLCYDDSYVVTTTYRDSLSLMWTTDRDKFCAIWVMKDYGICDSWEKLFNIDIEEHGLTKSPYFRHNGELLFRKIINEAHTLGKTELVSYDCNKNQTKNLGVILASAPIIDSFFPVYEYVESLVLFKGAISVEIYEESTKISKNT